jgi:diaminopimelate epimerase
MSAASMAIPFTKASACGNDFLLIQSTVAPADLPAVTRRVCHRHNGVGADGVEWLFPASQADVEARLLNADGSEAEISGNGTRCVAAYLCAELGKHSVAILTGAGLKVCTQTARTGNRYEFETAMGIADIGREFAVQTSSGEVRGIPVSIGNPHFVVFRDNFEPNWQVLSAEIQRDPRFPRGVNVEWVAVRERGSIDVRFFERGVGETQSSGTGSCASAVAAIVSGRADSRVRVNAPGGLQWVRYEGEVFLRGPAELICRGEFFI